MGKEGRKVAYRKKIAGNGKPVICVTLGLRAALTERGKVKARKVCGQPKAQTLTNRQTKDPKMLQETKRCMSNVQIKVEKLRKDSHPVFLSQLRAQERHYPAPTLTPDCQSPAWAQHKY